MLWLELEHAGNVRKRSKTINGEANVLDAEPSDVKTVSVVESFCRGRGGMGAARKSFADSGLSLGSASRPTSPDPEIFGHNEFAVPT